MSEHWGYFFAFVIGILGGWDLGRYRFTQRAAERVRAYFEDR